jgi:hypothetical protein
VRLKDCIFGLKMSKAKAIAINTTPSATTITGSTEELFLLDDIQPQY